MMMESLITATIVDIRPAEFTLLFESEDRCNAFITDPQRALSLYDRAVQLPALKILHKERQQSGQWLATLTCRSPQENKQCYWQLKLCRPHEETPESAATLPRRHLYDWSEKARQTRLTWLRQHTGHTLNQIATTRLQAEKLQSHLEGFIGSVEVPVGIAGPLLINGWRAKGIFYAPLATSEGALVASVSRGASAITHSGGATARVTGQRMMRSPRFEFPSVRDALAFCAWAEDYFTDISDIVRQHSRFARLTSLTPRIIGNAVHLTFTYHTADAAGQNMTTTCTWQACRWILAHLPLALTPQRYILESNLSSDKKSSWSSFAQGRGTQVIAEATLTAAACRSRLRIEPAQLVGAFQGFCEGSVAAGMTGVNINTANVIAAMFTALGQDIACSHESSLSQLQMRLTPEGNVYCSMTLPALVIGTVGGGTTLPDQAECLQMLGCQGANGSERLAEIIASFCLALDISTLSALASDEFAKSHERLGRQRRTAPPGRRGGDPLHRCFQHARYTAAWGEQPPAHIAPMRWQGNQDSILTALSSHSATLPVGLFAYRLQREDGTQVAALLKHKPPTDAITQLLHSLAAGCTPELAELLARLLPASEFSHAREREMALITQSDPAFTRHVPTLYGTYEEGQQSVIIEELLGEEVLLNSLSSGVRWQQPQIDAALRGIADIHALWYRRHDDLQTTFRHIDFPSVDTINSMVPLWQAIAAFSHRTAPQLFTTSLLHHWLDCAENSAAQWRELATLPRTLVHNDFSPRNIALRREDSRLCCWDWELATLHVPQRDLAELLTWTLDERTTLPTLLHHVAFHRSQLATRLGTAIDAGEWYRGFCLALRDFGLRRLSFYLMLHHVKPRPWFPALLRTWGHLVELSQQRI
ncbi:phosphotransferase [uncultured Kosakonia sp.]|uniref:phosphotransferase n=1 Tax=uncultured Kosakonia sp. TaxID=1588927 RepID=UPI002592969F|nr:phosphotransferase [uncultured Kosakonia sp.]